MTHPKQYKGPDRAGYFLTAFLFLCVQILSPTSISPSFAAEDLLSMDLPTEPAGISANEVVIDDQTVTYTDPQTETFEGETLETAEPDQQADADVSNDGTPEDGQAFFSVDDETPEADDPTPPAVEATETGMEEGDEESGGVVPPPPPLPETEECEAIVNGTRCTTNMGDGAKTVTTTTNQTISLAGGETMTLETRIEEYYDALMEPVLRVTLTHARLMDSTGFVYYEAVEEHDVDLWQKPTLSNRVKLEIGFEKDAVTGASRLTSKKLSESAALGGITVFTISQEMLYDDPDNPGQPTEFRDENGNLTPYVDPTDPDADLDVIFIQQGFLMSFDTNFLQLLQRLQNDIL